MLSAAASIGLMKVAVTPAVRAAIYTPRGIAALRRVRRERRDVGSLIGFDLQGLYDYRVPGIDHPLLELTEPHPDDLAAFKALAGPTLVRARESEWLEVCDNIETDYSHNMVLIGSPESEPLLRLLFDYRRIRSAAGLVYVGSSLRLPYRWEEDPREVRTLAARFVEGIGLVERPNWPIVVARKTGDVRLPPRVGHDGMLASDWLIVTVVPNYLTDEGLESGRQIISVAGSHGLGTRSIELVLSSRSAVQQINEHLGSRPSGYQVVIEARGIEHDERHGSRATEIRVHDVVELELNTRVLAAASRAVAARFTDWVVDDLGRSRPMPQDRR